MSGTRRIVRITGRGEAPWSIFSILINGLGSMAKMWNYEGELLLRACADVDYTIIRPGVMTGDERRPRRRWLLRDHPSDRADGELCEALRRGGREPGTEQAPRRRARPEVMKLVP